jgi:CrcB protein
LPGDDGAFLLGALASGLLERLPLPGHHQVGLSSGLCGGLTTFSTMQVETLQMIQRHHYALAASYTLLSVVAGLLAVYVATALVRRVSLL